MSVHVIKIPDIGEGIAEIELVAWHVKPGDLVVEDQALADVMTEKASVEIPSPVAGRVMALGGDVGQTLAVGSELMRIELASAGGAKVEDQTSSSQGASATPSAVEVPAAPAQAVKPSASSSVAAWPDAQRPLASPSVRRRARELELDLNDVPGSGPGGRILQADVDAATRQSAPVPLTHSLKPPDAAAGKQSGEHVIAVIGLRRKIAQKMQEAKRRIPHFSYVEEIDVTELEALRSSLNTRWSSQRTKLTLLPFIARAVVHAVRDCPQVNALFDDEAGMVTRYEAVHIGVATQTEMGLMVPVLRHAEALDLWGLALGTARLAEAARSGKATRDELSGSTITITSLGALGGIATTPIINRPEVAIIGVNRIVERPAYRHGTVVPRLLMNLSSSFDHRVVDGMDAARFIQAMRNLLEAPATLFIE